MTELKEALRDIDNFKNTLVANKDKLSDSLHKWRADIRAEEIKVCDDIKTIVYDRRKIKFKRNDVEYEARLDPDFAGIDGFVVSVCHIKDTLSTPSECKIVRVVGKNASQDKFECAFDNLEDLRRMYDSLNEYEESVSVARDFVAAYTQFLRCELKSGNDLMAKLLAK